MEIQKGKVIAMENLRRKLKKMPFDMRFGSELCHCTGYEICFAGDDPKSPANWWNEYVRQNGELVYGR